MSDKKSCKNKISTANYCLLAQESVTTGKKRVAGWGVRQ